MNEIKFKNLEDIENFAIRFKCFEGGDGYQATFHIYNKFNSEIHYQVDFEISRTEYSTDFVNSRKLAVDYIMEKYGDIENCFKIIGIKLLKEKISRNDLKDEKISLIKYLF